MSNTKKRDVKGFTVVELLIVLVLIAVLTIISTATFRSIQARSRSSSASTMAEMVAKKSEAWYSATGAYPTYTQLSTGKLNATDPTPTGPPEARIADTATMLLNATTLNPTHERHVAYKPCVAGGAQVEWYDAITNTVMFVGVGGGSSTAACS